MSNWYVEHKGDGIAVSSRIRLARNIEGLPFPSKMDAEAKKELASKIADAISKSDMPDGLNLKFIDMSAVSVAERMAMAERHIISPAFASNTEGRAILINNDETVSVMIGEEDHLRIQVILAGFCLDEAYALADKVDDFLSKTVKYAFDDKLGYLTECPTNLGIGMRASVMLHLPVIEQDGSLAAIIENAGKIGLAVRGLYGEGSKSAASLYQISNQITLGITENTAIDNLKVITNQIIEKEKNSRDELDKITTSDAVFRAYGVLKYARKLSSSELFGLISRVKLGVDMGIIDIDKTLPMKIMVESLPGMLQRKFGEMTPEDRDVLRAEKIREQLKD